MAVYTVQFDCATGITGQLVAGETIEMDAATAAEINEQCPGALKAYRKTKS